MSTKWTNFIPSYVTLKMDTNLLLNLTKTMKTRIILTHQKPGVFTLNGEDLTREELTLLLDLLGFDIVNRDDDSAFFENASISLRDVTDEEFNRVYNDFIIWKRISDVQRESEALRENAYIETI